MTECGTPSAIKPVYAAGSLDTLELVFAFNLRKMRGKLTQAEMAERLDMPLRTYQKFESGEVIPQAATRRALALSLGIPEPALFLDPDLSSPTAEQVADVLSAALQNESFRKILATSLQSYMAVIQKKK